MCVRARLYKYIHACVRGICVGTCAYMRGMCVYLCMCVCVCVRVRVWVRAHARVREREIEERECINACERM